MKLKFSECDILEIAGRYKYKSEDDNIIKLKDVIKKQGYINKDQLKQIAKWKSSRTAGYIKKNSDDFVIELSRFSFSATNERLKIEILTLLNGVSWPTASVILHLFHSDKYPILDYRALWSCSLDVPSQYDFSFWWRYVKFCRDLADRNKVSMRILDRALWQYSKENQSII